MVRLSLAILASVAAGVVHAASDTCAQVASNTKIEVKKQLSLAYTVEQGDYWSEACGDLKPSCILYPKTANEVAAIINILNQNTEKFAIKSGGHNPNLNFSSIQGGPLVSTKKLNEVTLDKNTGRVRVGPGNRWDEVLTKLDGSGWTVVGGRVGNVGVGGFLLGGGLSFLTQQYGWAVSSIVEYEVVLANGTITTASATQNADLFKALKGGGNNFGVVTSYLLQGYKQGQVYGGYLMFASNEDNDAALLKALRDFTEYNRDDKAAIILTANKAVSGVVDIWTMFVFYDGPTPPQGTFNNFTDVGAVVDTLKKRSYADLLIGNNVFVLEGSVYSMGTETFPLPSAENGAEVMGKIHSDWRKISEDSEVTGLLNLDVTAVQGYQPFPKRMAAVARAKGADLMDYDDDVDRIIVEINWSYAGISMRPEFDALMEKTYDSLRTKVLGWQEDGKMEKDVYLPLFLNDCFHSQDYFSRLRPENHQLAKTVASKYDPAGLFKTRTGGFKP